MAHNCIWQIEEVPENQYEEKGIELLNELMLDFNDFPMRYVDGWSNCIKDPFEFNNLVSVLPKGMFKVDKDNMCLEYVERPKKYLERFVKQIKKLSKEITEENLTNGSNADVKLWMTLQDNGYECLIYTQHDKLIYFHEWILNVVTFNDIGDKFYLGGVLDYKS